MARRTRTVRVYVLSLIVGFATAACELIAEFDHTLLPQAKFEAGASVREPPTGTPFDAGGEAGEESDADSDADGSPGEGDGSPSDAAVDARDARG